MFCLKCGKEIDNNATICPYCNSATENTVENIGNYEVNTAKPTSNGLEIASIVISAIGIGLALLIALLGYIFGGAGLAMAIIARTKDGFTKQVATGMILSIVALGTAVINSILGIIIYGGF